MNSSSTGEEYFGKILQHFLSYDERIQQNLIAICTDNAYNMKDAGLFNILRGMMHNFDTYQRFVPIATTLYVRMH